MSKTKEKYEIYDKNNALVDEKDFEIKSKSIISNSIKKADNEYFDGVSNSINDFLNKKSTTNLKNEMDKNQKRYMRNIDEAKDIATYTIDHSKEYTGIKLTPRLTSIYNHRNKSINCINGGLSNVLSSDGSNEQLKSNANFVINECKVYAEKDIKFSENTVENNVIMHNNLYKNIK